MNIITKIKKKYDVVKRTLDKTGVDRCDRFHVFWDIIYCRAHFHCSYEEYLMYRFYRYQNNYRKYFVTYHHRKHEYLKLNPALYTASKNAMYQKIKRGISRDTLYAPSCGEERFLQFVRKHGRIIVKPDVGSCGKNIQVYAYENDAQALSFFRSIPYEFMCEEVIVQHPVMAALNPSSVNTIRLVALLKGTEIEYISASVKSGGLKGAIVDNMHSDGVGAAVDIATGIVKTFGIDYCEREYAYHPVTGCQIIGMNIPYWKETLELVKNTHMDIPECPLLGWDVAITPSGPEIIEINGNPGPKLMQLMDRLPKGKSLLSYAREIGKR